MSAFVASEESFAILKTLRNVKGDFAASLVAQAERNYRNGLSILLSEKQAYWARKLADEYTNPPQAVKLERIVAIFAKAREYLKSPKIRLQTSTGLPIVLKIAGDRSKYAGSVVVSAAEYGQGFWGTVAPDGEWQGKAPDDVRDVIQAFNDNPSDIGGKLGILTGSCCFCARELSDSRSTSVGYGPICAKHFGLEWGTEDMENELVDDIATPFLDSIIEQDETEPAMRRSY